MDSSLLSVILKMRHAFIFFLLFTCVFSFVQPYCLKHERIALLQLKDSFTIDKEASWDPLPYPKVASWASKGNNSDCCSWDGVKCDDNTEHVIALDLTSSWLYGTIDSNSSLFQLSQLQYLSLAYNDFNYSQIPSRLGNLSRLTYLDLSFSSFKGSVPSEISQLPGLVSLNLSGAQINSSVPHFFTNLSSLENLHLQECSLYGEFPKFILQLPNLRLLDLSCNQYLSGSLPDFSSGLPLQKLILWNTSFSGTIPSSIENLESLDDLELGSCLFSGSLPPSLGKLKTLSILYLRDNHFTGPIPSFLQNLTQLTELWLSFNQFSGQIPPWIGNFTQLHWLALGQNKLRGQLPHSISRLANLRVLQLYSNELSGTLEFDIFFNLKYLSRVELSNNKLSVHTETSNPNATISKFEILRLRSCNFKTFPSFLLYQKGLKILDLSENQIYGRIPKRLMNVSIELLEQANFSGNLLTGFEQSHPVILPWVRLGSLDLSQNKLKGSIPIPPPSIIRYYLSNNELSGNISPYICNISSPEVLDLSNNKLSGMLPKCLEKLSNDLSVLNLGNNYFHIMIPQIGTNGSNLNAIDLSYNQLEGPLPRSLANCSQLEILNLGNNKLNDVFPSWLGTLPKLRILLLRQNHFHGVIKEPASKYEFPELHVIDLSYNGFSGSLPSQNFKQWVAMKGVNVSTSSFSYEEVQPIVPGNYTPFGNYSCSMNITNRGNNLAYERIPEAFIAMDFSSNRFEGEIPDCIGSLQGIQVLNLSNNLLTGSIPTSMGNMTRLESLDLSQNKLSGKIPPQLVQLTFLAFLNVSHNNLTGLIPRGKQFNTFENSSFMENLGLCGDPLSKKCENSESPTPPNLSSDEQDSWFLSDFNWMTILFGYLGGLVVGIVIENIVAWEYGWPRTTFLLLKLKLREWRRHRA